MIANREDCIPAHELADLLAGKLTAERFACALAHVDTCQACAAAAEAVQLSGGFSWANRSAAPALDSYDYEPECQAIVGQLLLQTNLRSGVGNCGLLPVESLGPYRLLKWLGAGGMGAVYLAEHQRLKRLTAIKVLPRDKVRQSDWLERFNREMTSIASLEHPHVVRAIDAGDQDGWHYLVMEYLDGSDLSRVCRCVGQLPIGIACELIRQASLGLAAIHELGMTHRDIKPSNMFLTRQGVVKLLDLGLVLSGESPLAADERLTTVGHLMGTLPYMAREQLLDASDVDWRADIYSLGATLFRMLTGHAPLGSAKNIAQTIQAITGRDCPAIESLLGEVPRELAQLINRMLSHDREARPQTVMEVVEGLTPFCDHQASQAFVRSVLGQLERETDSEVGQSFQSLVHGSPAQNGQASKPPSRRQFWIAAAFLPFAFLAGIILTVATDRGTLVIESEQPGITVKVSRGDKVIDSLKVENHPGLVRLYSGTYIVELAGADGDGLELSESQVTVTRGQKQLLHVHKKSPSAPEVLAGGKSFQGKPMAYWMELLDREKDVAMLAQAMHAVALLAESDADKLAAAKKTLLPARVLGGYIMSGRPQGANYTNVSGWYMTELMDAYAGFLPEPGLEAIVDELEAGHQPSALACFMILGMYGNKTFGSSFGAQVDVKLSEHLSHLATHAQGRALLERLDKACEKWADSSMDNNAKQMPIYYRLALADMLGKEESEQPQLVEWARHWISLADNSLREGASNNGALNPAFSRSPIPSSVALKTSRVLREEHSLPLLLGLFEPLSIGSTDEEARLTEMVRGMIELHPEATMQAAMTHLERSNMLMKAQNPSMGFMGGGGMFTLVSPERSAMVQQLLAERGEPLKLVQLLAEQLQAPDSGCIISKTAAQELLIHFAHRLELESQLNDDSNTDKKDAIALYVYGILGLPKSPDKLIEAISAIVAKERKIVRQTPSEVAASGKTNLSGRPVAAKNSSPFPFEALNEAIESDNPNEFVGRARSEYLPKLVGQRPQLFIEAFIKRLESGNYGPSQVLDPLFSCLNHATVIARQLDRRGLAVDSNLLAFVSSPEAQPSIESLESAHRRALQAFVDQPIAASDTRAYTLSHLTYTLIALNQFLRRDIHAEPFVKESLERLFKQACKQNAPQGDLAETGAVDANATEHVSLGLLIYYAKHFGYAGIPFELLTLAEREIAQSDNGDDVRRLVYGVYNSRPAEFNEYFTKHLEEFAAQLKQDARTKSAGELEDAALLLYGGLRCKGGPWYDEIARRLIAADSPTRERAVTALQIIAPHLPKDLAMAWITEQ